MKHEHKCKACEQYFECALPNCIDLEDICNECKELMDRDSSNPEDYTNIGEW